MTEIALPLGSGLVMLFVGAEILIKGAISLGLRFNLSPVIIGVTVVAFGTSAPELVVSTDAALAGLGGMAIGNVVGSNICNLALIMGTVALLRPAAVDTHLIRASGPIMIASAALLTALLLKGGLSRGDGLLLLAGIVAYTLMTLRMKSTGELMLDESPAPLRSLPLTLALVAGGLALLIVGGGFFVSGGAKLALTLGVAPAVVGLTVMAAGTSMPELATSLLAAIRGHGALATGNIIGSNIFNVLAIPGVAALATPFDRGGISVADLVVMLAVSVIALAFMFTGSRLTRIEGAILLAIYAGYCSWLFVR